MAEERGIDPDDDGGSGSEECYARRAGGGRWKDGASEGSWGACPTVRTARSGRTLSCATSPTKRTGRSASQVCWPAVFPLWGTSRAITAIAIAAIAIQYNARFGWKAFIAGGGSIARAGDKGDDGNEGGTRPEVFFGIFLLAVESVEAEGFDGKQE